MIGLYLHNEALNHLDKGLFIAGLKEVLIVKEGLNTNSKFLKHETVWNLSVLGELFADYSQENQVLINFLKQLNSCENLCLTEGHLDSEFTDRCSAFSGINFNNLGISAHRSVADSSTFSNFHNYCIDNISFRDLWKVKQDVFPNLIFCDGVKNDILSVGQSKHFTQIISKLLILDLYSKQWETGKFDYNDLNRSQAVRVSPESDSTINMYSQERTFKLPVLNVSHLFDLHLKTGDLRFHFYPDNETKTVYVGYIGSHLRTVSN
jgi:hypothetical protein